MTAAGQLSNHKHLGHYCDWCNALADVVATWQLPAAAGDAEPYGSLRHVPLCAPCGLRALNSKTPPVVVAHDAAVVRHKKANAARRALARKQLRRNQQTMEV